MSVPGLGGDNADSQPLVLRVSFPVARCQDNPEAVTPLVASLCCLAAWVIVRRASSKFALAFARGILTY